MLNNKKEAKEFIRAITELITDESMAIGKYKDAKEEWDSNKFKDAETARAKRKALEEAEKALNAIQGEVREKAQTLSDDFVSAVKKSCYDFYASGEIDTNVTTSIREVEVDQFSALEAYKDAMEHDNGAMVSALIPVLEKFVSRTEGTDHEVVAEALNGYNRFECPEARIKHAQEVVKHVMNAVRSSRIEFLDSAEDIAEKAL